MKDLLDEIINKNFDIAETLLKGHLASIVESKLNEKKKMCAAEMTDYPDLPKSGQKLRRGLTEDETEPPFEKPYGKVESGSNAKKDAKRLARKAMKAQKEKADKESKEQVNEMVGKGRLSKKKKKELSQRIDDKMDDEQVKSLGHKFGGEPFNMDDYNKDTEKLVRNKKYMRMSTMKSKLDYPEYFKEEDLEEASLKRAYTKAKKFFGHKKRVSDAATKAMDSDSWEKNLAKVTKVVKKND